jgi:hypothetical protein
VRTRLSICARKARFAERNAAIEVASRSEADIRVYRCDRCLHFHLTSRTKGKRIPRPLAEPS